MQELFNSIYIETPLGLQKKFSQPSIPLSALYDNGFFVSEIFGTEAWVINDKTYETQNKYILSPVPDEAYKAIKKHANKQYKHFMYLVDNNICRFAD